MVVVDARERACERIHENGEMSFFNLPISHEIVITKVTQPSADETICANGVNYLTRSCSQV